MSRGKKSDQREEPDDGVAVPGADQGATAGQPGDRIDQLKEMMKSFMRYQKQEECCLRNMEEQVFMIKEERRLRRQDGRLAEELDRINVWYGDQTQRERKVMQRIKEYRMELQEQDRQKQQKEEAERIMERQLLEGQRQRQANLTAQKARKEEETFKREELVKILEENNRQLKSELERAANKKLEKVNSSLQRRLQRRLQSRM
ncbi:arginine and glutamate-rich protein 1-like [Pseudochaenichthys georgianus]|uniref:arginine and glutamate-rich protein 1-like n=1 Tax=Pseudochaenichthys georgianus TaxID=52239 RepID=UPI00146A8526|nr:arginine and glutamate-rich protein 1-like [Pseudochaenichthys georgianus]